MELVKYVLGRFVLPPLGFFFIYFICITSRVKIINREIESAMLDKGINPIYTFWHGRILYFPFLYRGQRRHHILVSPSSDGLIIGNILRLFGFFVVWGSSYKQGARALLAMVRKVKRGGSAVLIADGSRGPVFKVQPGTVSIASLTGSPIIPMVYGADKKVELGSWDKFLLPLPFSRVVVIYGNPVFVPKKADKMLLDEKRKELEDTLQKITQQADGFFEL